MRALITTTIAAIAAAPVSAFASGGRVDDSGIFVWVFLGFCAMIVVAQVVPAVLLMVGMAILRDYMNAVGILLSTSDPGDRVAVMRHSRVASVKTV